MRQVGEDAKKWLARHAGYRDGGCLGVSLCVRGHFLKHYNGRGSEALTVRLPLQERTVLSFQHTVLKCVIRRKSALFRAQAVSRRVPRLAHTSAASCLFRLWFFHAKQRNELRGGEASGRLRA